MGGDRSAAASAGASPALTVDILDEMHVHPVYGLLSERRGPTGMQAAGPEGPRAASRLGPSPSISENTAAKYGQCFRETSFVTAVASQIKECKILSRYSLSVGSIESPTSTNARKLASAHLLR